MTPDERPFSAWTHKMAYAQAFTPSRLPVHRRPEVARARWLPSLRPGSRRTEAPRG